MSVHDSNHDNACTQNIPGPFLRAVLLMKVEMAIAGKTKALITTNVNFSTKNIHLGQHMRVNHNGIVRIFVGYCYI